MASGSGIENNALGSEGVAQTQAGSAYSTLLPQLTQMATNPTGFTPAQQANMLTAGEQSAGGAVSGATGQGNLMAARTGNAGGYAAALDASARGAAVTNSETAVGVDNASAQLAEQQRQEALSGLQGVYGTANATAGQDLGIANNASQNGFWRTFLTNAMAGASQVGAAKVGA